MNIAYIFSTLSLGLCVFFFFYFRAFLKRRTAAEELLAEYRAEVYRLIAEIDAATDRDSLLVEERIKTLKALLEDTDKRIAVYLRELERSRTGEALYTSLGRGIRAALGPEPAAALRPSSPPPSPVVPQAWQETPMSETPIAAAPTEPQAVPGQPELPQTTAASANTAPRQQTAPPREAAPKQLRSQIAALAAEGFSPAEIASRLGLSLSEVDLALNLLRKH